MLIAFKKKSPGRLEFGIIYGGIALLVLIVSRFFPVLSYAPSCVFRGLTNLPCPTCGSTRSVVHLSHGEFMAACAMNPLVAVGFVAAAGYFFYSVLALSFALPRIVVIPTEREKKIFRVGAAILVISQWWYLVQRS